MGSRRVPHIQHSVKPFLLGGEERETGHKNTKKKFHHSDPESFPNLIILFVFLWLSNFYSISRQQRSEMRAPLVAASAISSLKPWSFTIAATMERPRPSPVTARLLLALR